MGGDVSVLAGSGLERGGSVSITAGNAANSQLGGDIEIVSGGGDSSGNIVLKTSGDKSSVQLSDSDVSIKTQTPFSDIKLTAPKSYDSEKDSSMIAMGFTTTDAETGEEHVKYDFRLKSTDSDSLIVASAPMQVTKVQFSSDSRIKKDVKSVDEDAILRKIQNINIRSYE